MGRDNPAVLRMRPAHLLHQTMPPAEGHAAHVVLVNDREDARVARRDPSRDIEHDGGHEYIAGPITAREASALPRPGDRDHLELRRWNVGTVIGLEDDLLVRGHTEQFRRTVHHRE